MKLIKVTSGQTIQCKLYAAADFDRFISNKKRFSPLGRDTIYYNKIQHIVKIYFVIPTQKRTIFDPEKY